MSLSSAVVWHGDGRESALLNHVLQLPNLGQIRGQPEAILSAIDEWSSNNQILMTIGPERGDLVLGLILDSKPTVMVELGGYIGYSAIKFGSAVRSAGGQRYLSFESNAAYADIARTFIELAGLQDFVHVTVGSSSDSLKAIAQEQPNWKIDMFFIDHAGCLYDTDFKLAEDHNLLSGGAVIIADNICDPAAKDYVARMQSEKTNSVTRGSGGHYKSRIHHFKLQTGESDGIMVSWATTD